MEPKDNQSAITKDVGGTQGTEQSEGFIPADPYANVKRELSDEELKSPVVQKLLLNDNYRMENEVKRLKHIEELYHSRDKEVSVLTERLKVETGFEILYTACETVGSLLVGIATLGEQDNRWWITGAGAVLIIGGIVYKFFRK